MNKPKKFRKRPVVIEAMQFTRDNGQEVVDWIRSVGQAANWNHFSKNDQSLDIVTLEGVMLGSINDYIIKELQGEMYPCKPDIFLDSYEAVTD
jgi:hypothetical protein